MRAQRSSAAVAVVETRLARAARVLPPIDDELSFDFEPEAPAPAKPAVTFASEGAGVKAAILRWLEERA